jgi:hypothetical protein
MKMSTKTTKTIGTEKNGGRVQSRIERIKIIKEAAERHRVKALWYNEKLHIAPGR